MPCCKAEEFGGWCDGCETFEYKGKEFCIFHAPAEAPEKQDVEAFNNEVFKRIDECKEREIKCDLSGSVLPGYIDFSNKILPEISFDGARFWGSVNFRTVKMAGNTNISSAVFQNNAYFEYAEFSGDLNLINTVFTQGVSFSKATFNKLVDLSATEFQGYAAFRKAYFMKSLLAYAAFFKRNADFSLAYIGSGTFDETEFGGDTNMRQIKSRSISFNDVVFGRLVDFSGAIFDGAYFERAMFNGVGKFVQTVFYGASFKNSTIKEYLDFKSVDMSRVSIVNAWIERMHFINCRWPTYKSRTLWPCSEMRRTIWDANIIDNNVDLPVIGKNSIGLFVCQSVSPYMLAETFRKLKRSASEARDEPLASDWHYAEKEMQRRAAWKDRKGFWAALGLYRVFSGYGEAPLRAGLWLLFLLALPVALHLLLGGAKGLCPNPEYCLPWTAVKAEIAWAPWSYYGLRLYQVLVIVQAGLFGFATRNKMRR